MSAGAVDIQANHPDMGDRFFLFEVVDLWMTDSESSPSKRTAPDGKAAAEIKKLWEWITRQTTPQPQVAAA